MQKQFPFGHTSRLKQKVGKTTDNLGYVTAHWEKVFGILDKKKNMSHPFWYTHI